MKKPLQEEKKVLFTLGGQIRMHRASDAKRLIEAANKYLRKGDFEKKISITEDHYFERALSIWMDRLVLDRGITGKFADELNKEIKQIRFRHILMFTDAGLPYWEYVADLTKYWGPKTDAAYAFSQQLAIGGFDGIKRCGMPNCKRFFIGRPNAKWCSKACGSWHRVNQKRKRDRN